MALFRVRCDGVSMSNFGDANGSFLRLQFLSYQLRFEAQLPYDQKNMIE